MTVGDALVVVVGANPGTAALVGLGCIGGVALVGGVGVGIDCAGVGVGNGCGVGVGNGCGVGVGHTKSTPHVLLA
ncbi:hypothetical protein KDW_12380 [Dictyobacter vulcani]|uniref:Uncharacterized protein n=1 Tax=Dictyobacter vulcani TaxID=2607529 RepID=A0A5J4KPH4_9CHLR|nr:hypothetical protein KDW_12380 [Dictyobacter vulcani]